MQEEIAALARITDPWLQVRKAHDLVGQLAEYSTEASRIRREALEVLLSDPQIKPGKIANHLGISRQRVTQLANSGPKPERAFLGKGTNLTMVVGGKSEGDKSQPGPVVSTDDLGGYRLLSDAGRDLGFTVEYEVLQPPGFVDLSRDNLLVCCGPRLSPLIEQSLRADNAIRFEHDDDGWFLHDRVRDQIYRSPMDSGVSVDYGYLARLPRVDGAGTYLYSAGIHAPGVTGGLHYMLSDLADIYRNVRLNRFSCIVRCEFDPETRRVLDSERVTDLYRPEQGATQ
ncbi:sigma-70 family RNA polymerase sigma factor [Prauserella sp. PE36]|uniref:sigma-70 family RNA polymerase sigma factor n=1 Tax=Prauserella sp. PE36 TaxID=1504709 RepID=UPI0011BFBC59|nr:sigma-70 family RNA polymerase sigma factor [Prauserella sp. PE36]